MPTDTLSLITSPETRALASPHQDDRPDGDRSTALAASMRNIAVSAVVPEWVLQAIVGHVRGIIERLARELDQLDIRLRLDLRRTPHRVPGGSSESIEALEHRILDLVADVQRLRHA